jgi:hypothetical protein
VLVAGCGEQPATLAHVTGALMEGRSGTLYESPADSASPWLRERYDVTVSLSFDGACAAPDSNIVAQVNGHAATWKTGGPGRYGCRAWLFGVTDVNPGDGHAPPTVHATIGDGVNTLEIEADLYQGTRATLANPTDGRVKSQGIVTVDFSTARPLEPPGTARLNAQTVNPSGERSATVIVGQSAVASVKVVAPPGPNKLYLDASFPDAPVTVCTGVATCRALPCPALGPFELEILGPAPP